MLKHKIKTLVLEFSNSRISYSGFFSKYFNKYHTLKYNTFSNAKTFTTNTRIISEGRHGHSIVGRIMGFTSAVVGVFGGGKSNSGGLNFNFSPHYSTKECQETNLKAMIVAMLMHDTLDGDELAILMNSIQSVYQSKDIRREWCGSEMKNFMNCSERYGDFQDERCKNYRKMLKSCLQSKKCAVDLNPPKIRKYNPPNLRKIPLSKCPPANDKVIGPKTGCPADQRKNACKDRVVEQSSCGITTTCRPSCGCHPAGAGTTRMTSDDSAGCSEDPWMTKKEDEGARRWIYEQSNKRKDSGDNALDYEDWCRQQDGQQ